jgi:hypothetical protein
MPFIVGVPRSGTTLLRMMLDAHPEMAVPPETGFFNALASVGQGDSGRRRFLDRALRSQAWADFHIDDSVFAAAVGTIEPFRAADALRTFYRLYADRCGKRRCGDKTPAYLDRMPLICALLPEARFVHIIRDGRDVALSWQKTWFAPSDDLAVLARLWQNGIRVARADAARVPAYLEVRFEALVEHTERELRRICAFVDLEFDAAMLRYHEHALERIADHEAIHDRHGRVIADKAARIRQKARLGTRPDRSRVGSWRTDMTPEDRSRVESAAGRLLAELGYLVR